MSFKIPNIINYQTQSSLMTYFIEYFGRIWGSDLIKTIIIPFSGWDMVSDASFNVSYSAVGTNIKFLRITGVSVSIYNNDVTINYDASFGDSITSVTTQTGDQVVTITRKSGGIFDSSDFSEASGKVVLWVTT